MKSKDLLGSIKNLIVFDEASNNHVNLVSMASMKLFSYQDLVNEGYRRMELHPQTKNEPLHDSIYMLGITSGSTGEPKAAMLTHRNFISGMVCSEQLGYNFSKDDVYLSYAPLSHVQEHIMHINALIHSFRVGYNSGSYANLIKDIQILEPTVFGSFPFFFNKMYAQIKKKIETFPSIIQVFIDSAIQTKILNYIKSGETNHYVYDMTIFKLFRSFLGGRIRMLVSGGAPLSGDVKNFLTVVFGAHVFEAYGATEVAGCLTSTAIWDRDSGHVGGILPCLRMHLKEIPDFNCNRVGG